MDRADTGQEEQSLRYFAGTELQSLHATINDECAMPFEVDGQAHAFDTFHLGRAC